MDVGRRGRSSALVCPWRLGGAFFGTESWPADQVWAQKELVDLLSRLEAGCRFFEPPLHVGGDVWVFGDTQEAWGSRGYFNVFGRTLTSESPTRPKRCFRFFPRAAGCIIQSFCPSLIRFVSHSLTHSKTAIGHRPCARRPPPCGTYRGERGRPHPQCPVTWGAVPPVTP